MSTIAEQLAQIEEALGDLKLATEYAKSVNIAIETGGDPTLVEIPFFKSLPQIAREPKLSLVSSPDTKDNQTE